MYSISLLSQSTFRRAQTSNNEVHKTKGNETRVTLHDNTVTYS